MLDKPFLVFSGLNHDASGGWDDFRSAHATLDAAKAALMGEDKSEWGHIVDARTLQIVAKGHLITPRDSGEYWREFRKRTSWPFGFL